MTTTSTKSRNKKASTATVITTDRANDVKVEISERAWRISAAAIVAVGAFLRLVYLTLVPLHHDEGVNGNFLVSLVRNGTYTYDPNNYHGPTLYYFAAIIPWVARFLGGASARDAYGLTTFNIRFVTVAFGVGTIVLALMLRTRLGSIGALSAAALIALSPGAVYLSRYFIHESLFVFFTLGIIVAALKYYDTGASVYLILAAISAALMTATKETWVINGPVLLMALVTTTVYCFVRWALKQDAVNKKSLEDGRSNLAAALSYPIDIIAVFNLLSSRRNTRFHALQSMMLNGTLGTVEILLIGLGKIPALTGVGSILLPVVALSHLATVLILAIKAYSGATPILPVIGTIAEHYSGGDLLERFGGPISVATVALMAFTVFIVVNVFLYSSFFTNYPKGVNDALLTLSLWRKRTEEHAHPFLQYFDWLRQEEVLLLLLGGVGAGLATWLANNRLALFLAQWSFGLLVGYSLVRYKTPWIGLNFIVPLALTGGYTLNHLYKKRNEPWSILAIILGAILLLVFDRFVKFDYGPQGKIAHVGWNLDLSNNGLTVVAIVCMAAFAGYVWYARDNEQRQPINFWVAAAAVALVMGYQMYQLNFVHYDDDKYVYVYAHTRRETLVMLEQIDKVANQMKTGYDTGVAIVSPEYWPLPWYFRDYKRVGYYGKVVQTSEPVIIGQTGQEEEIKATFGEQYQQIDSSTLNDPRIFPDRNPEGSFSLRPGVDLLLYVRRDARK